MKDAQVEYPCWWTYAIIGADEEGLRLAAGAVTRGHKHKVTFSKESSRKRYVSLHVEIWVTSQHQRDRLFQTFQNHPQVRMVI